MPKVYTFFLDSNFFRVLKITQETGDTASLRTTETNIGLKDWNHFWAVVFINLPNRNRTTRLRCVHCLLFLSLQFDLHFFCRPLLRTRWGKQFFCTEFHQIFIVLSQIFDLFKVRKNRGDQASAWKGSGPFNRERSWNVSTGFSRTYPRRGNMHPSSWKAKGEKLPKTRKFKALIYSLSWRKTRSLWVVFKVWSRSHSPRISGKHSSAHCSFSGTWRRVWTIHWNR